jgi:hypothetical protein
MTMTNWMRRLAVGAAALALCAAGGRAMAHEDGDCHAQHAPNPQLYPLDARPFGVGIERWAEDWWRWAYSMPATKNPNLDFSLDGNQNQFAPVYFLPGYFTSPPADGYTVTVPREMPIAFDMVSILNDYPCPDPTFQPAPGQSLYDFLVQGAEAAATTAEIDVTLDGQTLEDLTTYHYVSDDIFYIKGDTSLQPLDACITGSPQPAVVDSYFAVIKPLPPGKHTLTTRIVTKAGVVHGPNTTVLDVK